MKKQTLLRFMIGLALIISLIGCQTKVAEEPVVAEPAVVEEAAEPAAEEVVEAVEEVVEEPVEEAVVEEAPAEEAPAEVAPVEEVVMDDINLKLIATSDINGKLFPQDVVKGINRDTSLAQIYSYVAEERADDSQSVILLDAGNVLQGDLILDYYNYLKPNSEHIVASVMNAMGYDAAVPGADDVAVGQDLFVKVGMESAFPWMAANAVGPDGKPLTYAYSVIKRGGATVAVLGLVSDTIAAPAGITIEDPVTAAKKWVPIIEARVKPDVIVALVQAEGTDAGAAVAKGVRGLDLVVSGTKSMTVKNPDGMNIAVVGATSDAKSVGTADITLSWDKATESYMVSAVKGRIQSMASYPVSQVAMGAFGYAVDELKAAVMTEVGYLASNVESTPALFGDSAYVDMLHEMQLKLTGADISFAAAPMVGLDLYKGPIYARDILLATEMFGLESGQPWLYTAEMTGAEIDAYLEYSYGMWFKQMKSINDGLLKGLDYYNWDSAAGIKYVVDVRKPAGQKVNIKTTVADGLKFESDKVYTVVLNAYRAADVAGYISKGVGLTMKEAQSRVKSVFSVDLLKGFMMGENMLGTLDPVADENWFLSPIVWAKRGMEKDMALLK